VRAIQVYRAVNDLSETGAIEGCSENPAVQDSQVV
jgi:hypothetical protein